MGALSRRSLLAAAASAGSASLALLAAGSLAGCSGGDEGVSDEPTTASNPTEGKLGGKLTLYTSCSESLINAVVPAYMAEHAVAVTVVRGNTAQLMELIASEAASGAPVADVMWGGDASWYADVHAAVEGGAFEAYISNQNSSVREDCRNVDGLATPVSLDVPVIALGPAAGEWPEHTAMVREYADLGASDIAGSAVMEDPAASEAGLLALAALVAGTDGSASETNEAWELAATLHATAPVVEEDEAGDGEAAVHALLDQTAPIALALEQSCMAERNDELLPSFYYPLHRIWAVPSCTAVVQGASNLAQAHAWIDFVASQECQQALVSEAFARSVRDDVGTPEGLYELDTAVAGAQLAEEEQSADADGGDAGGDADAAGADAAGADAATDDGSDDEGSATDDAEESLAPVVAIDRSALLATWVAVVDGTWEPQEEEPTDGADGAEAADDDAAGDSSNGEAADGADGESGGDAAGEGEAS